MCWITGHVNQTGRGIDTISYFNYNYSVPVKLNAFPLLTTKSVHWRSVVTELLWFLQGVKSADYLDKHKNTIWKSWTDEKNNINSGYGEMWRSFPFATKIDRVDVREKDGSLTSLPVDLTDTNLCAVNSNDQIFYIVNELKRNPNSRRLVVSAWNPQNAQNNRLPPCHVLMVFHHQDGKLNLHLTQRSGDIGLGIPFNIASYALLLCIICKLTGLEPGLFGHTIVDAHIYTTSKEGKFAGDTSYDHVEPLRRQLNNPHYNSPYLDLPSTIYGHPWTLENLPILYELDTKDLMDFFAIIDYQNAGKVPMKVAV